MVIRLPDFVEDLVGHAFHFIHEFGLIVAHESVVVLVHGVVGET